MANGIHGGKVSAGTRRRQKVARATPRWLTAEHRLEIHKIYCHAKYLNRTWRIGRGAGARLRNCFSVDHIVPLDGNKLVCGLHVPWNLRIIEKAKDNRKGDRLEQGEAGAGYPVERPAEGNGQSTLRVIDNLEDAIALARG